MSGAVKILCREIVSRGFGLLERVTWRRRKFDGTPQEITREFYDTGPGATILLYDRERRRILLVRQCRKVRRHEHMQFDLFVRARDLFSKPPPAASLPRSAGTGSSATRHGHARRSASLTPAGA